MDTLQLSLAKRYFDLSFAMLENIMEISPDEIWQKKKGGFVYWQQILHTLCGVHFWMRRGSEEFIEPFGEMRLYPELERDPEAHLEKRQLAEYKDKVKAVAHLFFDGKDDSWLYEGSSVTPGIKNIEIVYMQIRHIQYHAGHCECALREGNYKTAEWLD